MSEEQPPACGLMRAELAAYLYRELDPAGTAAVDAHLRTCAACRAALEERRATAALLDRWEAPAGHPDPAALAAGVRARSGGARRRRRRIALLAAAALLLILPLAAGFEASWSGGRLVLAFGRARPAEPAAARDEADWQQRVRELAREEWARRDALQTARVDELLERWGASQAEREEALLWAVEQRLERDRQWTDQLLDLSLIHI